MANGVMGFGTPQARKPSVLERLQTGILGPTPSYGGMIDQEAQAAAQRQGLLATGAQLLASSGWSPERITGAQALGSALMAGQGARNQGIDQALNAMLINTRLQAAQNKAEVKDPADVRSYEYAKKNGYTGTFEEWKRIAAAQPQPTSDVQNWEYYQKLPPEQKKEWMSLQRQPTAPQVVLVNGVPTLVDRIQGTQTPLTNLQSEVSAATTKASAEAQAKAQGTATGEALGAIQKKSINAESLISKLDLADALIDTATGSTTGAAADKVAAFFGKSLAGDQATAQLKVLQANLMTSMPRMEGPQSDADVKLYQQAAGEIGDPTVPRDRKKAALNTIRMINEQYRADGARKPTTQGRPPLSSFGGKQ